jgi:hypothetical protein
MVRTPDGASRATDLGSAGQSSHPAWNGIASCDIVKCRAPDRRYGREEPVQPSEQRSNAPRWPIRGDRSTIG